MKKSRLTDSQIIEAIKRVEAKFDGSSGLPKELGIGTATF